MGTLGGRRWRGEKFQERRFAPGNQSRRSDVFGIRIVSGCIRIHVTLSGCIRIVSGYNLMTWNEQWTMYYIWMHSEFEKCIRTHSVGLGHVLFSLIRPRFGGIRMYPDLVSGFRTHPDTSGYNPDTKNVWRRFALNQKFPFSVLER